MQAERWLCYIQAVMNLRWRTVLHGLLVVSLILLGGRLTWGGVLPSMDSEGAGCHSLSAQVVESDRPDCCGMLCDCCQSACHHCVSVTLLSPLQPLASARVARRFVPISLPFFSNRLIEPLLRPPLPVLPV